MQGPEPKLASQSRAKWMPSSMRLSAWSLSKERGRMTCTPERYRMFRRVESRLRRARVPQAACDRLARTIVGDDFRLRGDEAEFEINGVRLAAPRRFLSNYLQTSYEPE